MRKIEYVCDICDREIKDLNAAISTLMERDDFDGEPMIVKASHFTSGEKHFHIDCIKELSVLAEKIYTINAEPVDLRVSKNTSNYSVMGGN